MRIILVILLLLFFANAYAVTVDELSDLCPTPELLGEWLKTNVKFVTDYDKWGKVDYWQTPEQTLSSRNKYNAPSGDCEDISILAYTVLKKQGFTPYVMIVMEWNKLTNRRYSHAVCAFHHNGKWCYLEEHGFFMTEDANLFEIAKRIAPKLWFMYIYKDPIYECSKYKMGRYY